MKQRLTPNRLVADLGVELALTVMRSYGGQSVPRLTAHLVERIERNEAIRREVDDGDTYAAVGERYDLHRSRVARIASA